MCEVEQQCDQCGTTFRSVQALNRHAAVHGPPPYSCKACRRSYYRKVGVAGKEDGGWKRRALCFLRK